MNIYDFLLLVPVTAIIAIVVVTYHDERDMHRRIEETDAICRNITNPGRKK